MTFTPDDVVVSRASYAQNPDTAPRSVVLEVYDNGWFLRYCVRYGTKHLVERPEGWRVVGKLRPADRNGATLPAGAGGWLE